MDHNDDVILCTECDEYVGKGCFNFNANMCALCDYYKYEPRVKTSDSKDEFPETTSFHKIAKGIADLVQQKNAAYGNSFGQSAKILEILYPNGIKVENYDDVLTLARIVDKMFRIANRKDAFGESPYKDILGYALLAVDREDPHD